VSAVTDAGPADSSKQDVSAVSTRCHRDHGAVRRRPPHRRQSIAERRLSPALVVRAGVSRDRCPGRPGVDRRRGGRRAVAETGAGRSTQVAAGVLAGRRRARTITGTSPPAAAAAAATTTTEVGWQW